MRASVGQGDPPPDQPVENVAAGDIPPMPLVQLRHIVVDAAVHQANTHQRLSAKVSNGVTNRIGITGHQVGPAELLDQQPDEQLVGEEADDVDGEEAGGPRRGIVPRSPWPRKLNRLWSR